MSSVRYLGSKAKLVETIADIVGKSPGNARFVDLFSGTGTVSMAFGQKGWPVFANDFLRAASTITTARLISSTEVPFKKLGGYESAVKQLNNTAQKKGFFYREYSPSKDNELGIARPYFSETNARKIDGLRSKIQSWAGKDLISPLEKQLLIADLIGATNQVANIAGTYGCFLKRFSTNALQDIRMTPRKLHSKRLLWETLSTDAFLIKDQEEDVVYLDPPYTKRQYAAYYHIPETIACEDEPKVDGITGLRPWQAKASRFCYKSQAAQALTDLIAGLKARRIVLSYSSDGHIDIKTLIEILTGFGEVKVNSVGNFSRYTPNLASVLNTSKQALTEYIFDLKRY